MTMRSWIGCCISIGAFAQATAGIGGQIILNASNAAGTWTGDVVVGSLTLSPEPHYSQLSSQLGGGAVGLAPFKVHGQDCDPPHLSVLTDGDVGEGLAGIVVRHYGPVNFDSEEFPFVVLETELPTSVDAPDGPYWECCGSTCLGTPVDVSSSLTATRSPTNPREVILEGVGGFKFTVWHTYCIKPVLSGDASLYCEEVSGSPSVTDYKYRFAIIGSMFDLNQSGDVEYGDVTAWFNEPADFNGDDSADSADLAELIEAIPQ